MARCGEDPHGFRAPTEGCGTIANLCASCAGLPSWTLLEGRRSWLLEHECGWSGGAGDVLREMLLGEEHLHRARQLAYSTGLRAFAAKLTLAIKPLETLHQELKTV